MTWDKTTKDSCPQCGSALFRHFDRETRQYSLVCHKPDCGYQKPIEKPARRTKKKEQAEGEAEHA